MDTKRVRIIHDGFMVILRVWGSLRGLGAEILRWSNFLFVLTLLKDVWLMTCFFLHQILIRQILHFDFYYYQPFFSSFVFFLNTLYILYYKKINKSICMFKKNITFLLHIFYIFITFSFVSIFHILL